MKIPPPKAPRDYAYLLMLLTMAGVPMDEAAKVAREFAK